MKVWMNEWINESFNEWINDWEFESMNEWEFEWMNEWEFEWMYEWDFNVSFFRSEDNIEAGAAKLEYCAERSSQEVLARFEPTIIRLIGEWFNHWTTQAVTLNCLLFGLEKTNHKTSFNIIMRH